MDASKFDPRHTFSVTVDDLGPLTVWRPDASGVLTPRVERQRVMDVFIDGEREIIGGLVLSASDPLVAFDECSMCGLWECNLVEGWAAKVLRFGPYVFWLRPSGEIFTFDAEAYRSALGDGIDALPMLSRDDAWDFAAPDREAEYPIAVGGSLAIDPELNPEGAFAPLYAWPAHGEGDVCPVAPPAEAVEVRALNREHASVWIDASPRADGRRAAYMPAVTCVGVWCAGPAVDRVVEALLGPDARTTG